jgi:nucleoside-diphosphate-sugar epimerase
MKNYRKKQKILVTGGTGFIGKHLFGRLKKEGHQVEIFDLKRGDDLRDPKQVDKAVKGRDVVFHLAAIADLNVSRKNPRENTDVNITGTVNVANACWRHRAVLNYASTCCVYGNQKKHPVDENTLPNPSEIYAHSKLAGEHIILGYAKTCGLEYNIIRFATIYGPGMRPALGVHVFFDQALDSKPITIHGNGKQTRTLTYIDDLIDGIMVLFHSGVKNEIINLSTEEEVSALQMAKLIKKMTNSKSPIVFISQRPGQTFREAVSAQKAKKLLGWRAKTSFKEGLEKTYRWFKE